ncbi:Ribonuclease HII [bioreactor metagenome]|uniref:Ribonuclease HII n=1 Tax=bioreactor metagenome TaxID=1076179 RepID=A0A645C7A9_9ZZZZ
MGGMDEAGRGPLAGPVVAACVVLPSEPLVEFVNDSKKISEKRREMLFNVIISAADYGVGIVGADVIDEINILQATKLAFKQAYYNMDKRPAMLLVDAVKQLDVPAEQLAIIKGDEKSYLIAAASIIAKVTRDRMLREFSASYPLYGFARHKGYGTAEHIAALRAYGPCPEHRRTFIKGIIG